MSYEPIAQIGRGGMAEVLLAMMEAGGGACRLVVLKRLWPDLAADPDFVSMFLDEARLSLRLNHPNVVRTYDAIVGAGGLAIAMEYLEGQPLSRLVNRLRGPGELSLHLRLRIVANVLAGLEHAHTLRDLDGAPLEVVHRDVSPQNVFVTYDGQVKVVDFGVARTMAASHRTRPGAIKGKLAYMAPEQLWRAAVDRRADVFSAGVILWEILAGRRLWHGMSEGEILAHLATGLPLPALPRDAGLPAGLYPICARALDPDPNRRYPTAADLAGDLEMVLVGSAESHARSLGKIVSGVFETERTERQVIIDHWVRRGDGPRLGRPEIPADAEPELLTIELTRSDLEIVPAAAKSTARATTVASARAPWRRRAGTGGVLAIVTALLIISGWRRPAEQARAAQAPVQPARASTAAPLIAPLPPPAAAHDPADDRASCEPMRPARRHRAAPADDVAALADEDATLPPSLPLDARELAPKRRGTRTTSRP